MSRNLWLLMIALFLALALGLLDRETESVTDLFAEGGNYVGLALWAGGFWLALRLVCAAWDLAHTATGGTSSNGTS